MTRKPLLLLALALLTVPAAPARAVDFLARSEFLIEGGIAFPQGDLGGSFTNTELGLGAGNGYVVGVRYRQLLPDGFGIEPAFQFLRFSPHTQPPATEDDEETEFLATMLRFGLGVSYTAPGPAGGVRPLLSAALLLTKNNFQITYIDSEEQYDAAEWDLGLQLAGGVRLRAFELVLSWNLDRFSTPRFFNTAGPGDYDWSSVALTVGYRLPSI